MLESNGVKKMFLSVDTGIIIVGAIIAAILVFLLCDNLIKGKKRKQRLEEYRKKVQQENMNK